MVEGERVTVSDLELPRTYYLLRGEVAAENPEMKFSILAVIAEARSYPFEARNLFIDSFARSASKYLRIVRGDSFQFQFRSEANSVEAKKIGNWLSAKIQQPEIEESQIRAVNLRLSGL